VAQDDIVVSKRGLLGCISRCKLVVVTASLGWCEAFPAACPVTYPPMTSLGPLLPPRTCTCIHSWGFAHTTVATQKPTQQVGAEQAE
jgi:hypothetical protein